MEVSQERVAAEHEWMRDRAPIVVPVINDVRSRLADLFDTEVDSVTQAAYRTEVDTIFENGDLAVNVAALVGLLRTLDVTEDYPGFIIDEFLGRELAGAIAGTQPRRLLGEATFHFADVHTHHADAPAGADDLDAALAAGFQTRLPGWDWTATPSPYTV